MSKCMIYSNDDYDLICASSEDNFAAFKYDPSALFNKEPVTIGEYEFIPGKRFTNIGFKNKISAGYTWFHYCEGIEVEYVGLFKASDRELLLFNAYQNGRQRFQDRDLFGNLTILDGSYQQVWLCFTILDEESLMIINSACAGREIEMFNKKAKANV